MTFTSKSLEKKMSDSKSIIKDYVSHSSTEIQAYFDDQPLSPRTEPSPNEYCTLEELGDWLNANFPVKIK